MKPSFWIKTGILTVLISVPALEVHAGFEWVPPSATMQRAPQVRSTEPALSVPAPVAPMAAPSMPAVTMQPVIAEPIAPATQTMRAPTSSRSPVNSSSMPAPRAPIVQQNAVPSMRAPMVQNIPAPVSAPRTGLYINPYPLQGNNMPVETRGVDISLAEKGGALTPVQLGNGMSSGVMSPRAPKVRDPIRKSETRTNYNVPSSPSALTPMMGGEPAPLPGMPQGIFRGSPQAPVMAVPLGMPNKTYAKAVGFGKQLPLSLALSQVIPSEYSYRFDGDVDTDSTVSWDGGQSWDMVLQDMLAPQGLRAFIQGNQVIIARSARI